MKECFSSWSGRLAGALLVDHHGTVGVLLLAAFTLDKYLSSSSYNTLLRRKHAYLKIGGVSECCSLLLFYVLVIAPLLWASTLRKS